MRCVNSVDSFDAYWADRAGEILSYETFLKSVDDSYEIGCMNYIVNTLQDPRKNPALHEKAGRFKHTTALVRYPYSRWLWSITFPHRAMPPVNVVESKDLFFYGNMHVVEGINVIMAKMGGNHTVSIVLDGQSVTVTITNGKSRVTLMSLSGRLEAFVQAFGHGHRFNDLSNVNPVAKVLDTIKQFGLKQNARFATRVASSLKAIDANTQILNTL